MVSVTLDVPPVVARGAPVRFRMVLVNASDHPIDLYLHGREPTLDVVVSRENGDVVWRALAGVPVPATLQLLTLTPGDHLEVCADWDQGFGGNAVDSVARDAVPEPGIYLVTASLLAEGPAIEVPSRQLTIR